jgi:dTDP-4-dehydrorhamnose reductase
VEILAVTGWALLGAYDWNSLLTRRTNHYESGAYDIFDGVPRLTAVGHLLRMLATRGALQHPLLDAVGWWRRLGVKLRPAPYLLICGPSTESAQPVTDMCQQRGITYRFHLYQGSLLSNVPGLHELFRQCWGVIELTDGNPGSYLKVRCRRRRLPYASLPADTELPGGAQKRQRLLDLFIDEAIGMACLYPDRRTKYPDNYVKK